MIASATDDQAFLRRSKRPPYEDNGPAVKVVDLFSGCGGMTLGIAEGALELGYSTDVQLAVDFEPAAIGTFAANFCKAVTRLESVEALFGAGRRRTTTATERSIQSVVGRGLHFLVGGPPCQGHSDLNNHTRRADPKNSLYVRMARAAAVLNPRIVIIENVPTVLHDRAGVVQATTALLRKQGYRTADGVVDLSKIGVAQRRRRHLLVATKSPLRVPKTYLNALLSAAVLPRNIAWAIGDLENPESVAEIDKPSRQSRENERRASWLYDNDRHELPDRLRPPCHRNGGHSYKSVYGRLRWDEPAQTITSGFTSMGQGRYLHPSQRRTLTPHEAARLQFFPDFFAWPHSARTSLAQMIGNAVPPKLTMELARMVIPDLKIDGS